MQIQKRNKWTRHNLTQDKVPTEKPVKAELLTAIFMRDSSGVKQIHRTIKYIGSNASEIVLDELFRCSSEV